MVYPLVFGSYETGSDSNNQRVWWNKKPRELASLLSSSTTQTLSANIAHFKSRSGASPPLVQNRNLAWTSISDGFVLVGGGFRVYRSLTFLLATQSMHSHHKAS